MRPTLLLAAIPSLLLAQETATMLKDQKALAVTIYNDNLALVKDTREVRLPKGEARLAFQEVSAQIRPETASLRNLTAPPGLLGSRAELRLRPADAPEAAGEICGRAGDGGAEPPRGRRLQREGSP